MDKLMYSPKDAAKAAGLCVATIYELLGRGHLAAVKFGRRTLIPAESLKAYLSNLPPAEILAPSRDRRKAIRSQGLLANDRHSHKETAAAG